MKRNLLFVVLALAILLTHSAWYGVIMVSGVVSFFEQELWILALEFASSLFVTVFAAERLVYFMRRI